MHTLIAGNTLGIAGACSLYGINMDTEVFIQGDTFEVCGKVLM
jgi:hypothetical protein